LIVEGRCLRSFGRRHGDLAKGAHGSTTNHLLLETIRREREELSLLRSKGRIGDSVHASQYYSAFDGITNPIIPLAQEPMAWGLKDPSNFLLHVSNEVDIHVETTTAAPLP
jgi:hypothetical protein